VAQGSKQRTLQEAKRFYLSLGNFRTKQQNHLIFVTTKALYFGRLVVDSAPFHRLFYIIIVVFTHAFARAVGRNGRGHSLFHFLKELEFRMEVLPTPVSQGLEYPPQMGPPQAGVLADNTRMAYWGDLRRFVDWGGTVPSASKTVAAYLMAHASSHKYATLVRWKVSIGKAHTNQGLDDPTKSDAVHVVLSGIRRSHGKEQRKVAPLVKEQVLAIVGNLGERLKDKRDKALILCGFAAGLRRSELTTLTVADLRFIREGIEIHLPEGNAYLQYARGAVCPVRAMKDWLSNAQIDEGSVFQGINRHGQRSGSPLTGHGIALIVKERVQAIGLDPSQYSGFSLRAGLVASAVAAGIPFRTVTTLQGPGIL
jgi:site-specific recombinase XerD